MYIHLAKKNDKERETCYFFGANLGTRQNFVSIAIPLQMPLHYPL